MRPGRRLRLPEQLASVVHMMRTRLVVKHVRKSLTPFLSIAHEASGRQVQVSITSHSTTMPATVRPVSLYFARLMILPLAVPQFGDKHSAHRLLSLG